MDSRDLMVDGNALAGVLSEIFIEEMTTARVKCEGCGEVWPMGAEHVYMQAPGIVVRCRHCDDVLLAITQPEGAFVIGFQNIGSLEIQRRS